MTLDEYSERAADHFMCPRNAGSMPDADGEGSSGDPHCGDALTVYIKVEEDRITDISYLVFGCAGAIAASSITSVLIKGRTLEEAKQLTKEEIAAALGGFPERKMHCSLLILQAVHNAIGDYVRKRSR